MFCYFYTNFVLIVFVYKNYFMTYYKTYIFQLSQV